MVRWHHLIEIKGIKELTLSISSTPHHASLPSINQSIERNHGLKIVSMGISQQNPPNSRHFRTRSALRICAKTGRHWRLLQYLLAGRVGARGGDRVSYFSWPRPAPARR